MKTMLAVVTLLGISTSVLFAEVVANTVESGECGFYQKMQKEMTNASKRADYYNRKAEEEKQIGHLDISAAFKECADAKSGIADTIKEFLNASDSIHTECNMSDETNQQIKEIFAYRKGERLTTKIKNLDALKDKLKLEPVAAEGGVDEISQDNQKLSEEIDVINNSLEKYLTSRKDLKTALEKVKNLKAIDKNKPEITQKG